MIGPLIWLLGFDLVVCVLWWLATSVFGITAPPQLYKVMIGLVVLINVVIVVFWLLAISGVAPGALSGPSFQRR